MRTLDPYTTDALIRAFFIAKSSSPRYATLAHDFLAHFEESPETPCDKLSCKADKERIQMLDLAELVHLDDGDVEDLAAAWILSE